MRVGWQAVRGLASFMGLCGLGALTNVAVARDVYELTGMWLVAGIAGAAIGALLNYALTSSPGGHVSCPKTCSSPMTTAKSRSEQSRQTLRQPRKGLARKEGLRLDAARSRGVKSFVSVPSLTTHRQGMRKE